MAIYEIVKWMILSEIGLVLGLGLAVFLVLWWAWRSI